LELNHPDMQRLEPCLEQFSKDLELLGPAVVVASAKKRKLSTRVSSLYYLKQSREHPDAIIIADIKLVLDNNTSCILYKPKFSLARLLQGLLCLSKNNCSLPSGLISFSCRHLLAGRGQGRGGARCAPGGHPLVQNLGFVRD
jgi:hypothetical protein